MITNNIAENETEDETKVEKSVAELLADLDMDDGVEVDTDEEVLQSLTLSDEDLRAIEVAEAVDEAYDDQETTTSDVATEVPVAAAAAAPAVRRAKAPSRVPGTAKPAVGIPDVEKKPFKLPTGQTLRSNDPIKEFKINVHFRREALLDEHPEDAWLADFWADNAILRRKGETAELRAAMLGLDVKHLRDLEGIFDYLETESGHWKKAADFYDGMLKSGIFDKPVVLYGGIYFDHVLNRWDEFSIPRTTLLERVKAGVPLSELFKPSRPKAPAARLEYDGRSYAPLEFAKEFGIPKRLVRECIAKGLSADEILRAPRSPRGRPKRPAAIAGALKSKKAPAGPKK